jgi:hypothetical protein
MFEDPFSVSQLISSTALRRRLAAFLVTGLAVFLGMCLVWPVSVQGFRSVAGINVGDGADHNSPADLKALLAYAIRQETKEGQIESAIQEAELRTELESKPLEYRNYEQIVNSIQMGVEAAEDGFQLQIAYLGQGTDDEKELLNVLAERVAFRISTGRSALSITNEDQLAEDNVGLEPEMDPVAAFEQADWVLNQIQTDLAGVNHALTELEDEYSTQLLPSLDPAANDDNAFQLASNKTVTFPAVDEIRRSVESIDVTALRNLLHQIQIKTKITKKEPISILSVAKGQSFPVNGTPKPGNFLLLLSLAGLAGSIVAWHYNPFEQRGFQDAFSVSQQLGVPVVALVKTDLQQPAARDHRWANFLAKAASFFLVALTLVVIVFMIADGNIRRAFLNNPFDGLAQIVRAMVGY